LLLFPMRSCPARADVTLPPRAPIATGHIWRALRVGVRIAVEIHMMSAQCSGFLGADPDAQAQHDVGMYQLGRAANILQARAQLHRGQDPHCGDNRPDLL
jgi:hypothetical protein